jgi:hypothetical protein
MAGVSSVFSKQTALRVELLGGSSQPFHCGALDYLIVFTLV